MHEVGHHEGIWRAVRSSATHNRYFPEFDDLIRSVQQALESLARQPERVKALFGLYLDHLADPTAPLPPDAGAAA